MDSSYIKPILIITSLLTSLCSCQKNTDTNLLFTQEQKLAEFRTFQTKHDLASQVIKEGTVKAGNGFFQALKSVGIVGKDSLNIINELRDKIEFSKLKVGDRFSAKYTGNEQLIGFSFYTNPAEKHTLIRTVSEKNWSYQFEELPTQWSYRIIEGKLKSGSTLQADLLAQGLKPQTAGDIINILLCKVHFRLDAREGDDYKILLNERYYNEKILDTKILFTSYEGVRAGKHQAFFYEDPEKKSTYTAHYTEAGEALIRSGLRYPVKRLHIRSHYGYRRHPVTGKRSMHRGVDLRGRVGDPVFAAASGVVTESKFTKLGGHKVAIRHADNSVSYYLHLSKRLVQKGQRVKSYQRIGKVGATGRVTGPHLHFGFRKPNGVWMNPMHKRMIATPKLKGEKYVRLQKQILRTKVIMNAVEESHISENRVPASVINSEINLEQNT